MFSILHNNYEHNVMDNLDTELISLLRADARSPVSGLAQRLNVSRATVKARIDRLVETGVIQGFTITTGTEAPSGVRSIMMVEVEGKAAETVLRRLRGIPEVRTIYATNGRWDIVAELETANLGDFDEVLRRIRLVDGISATETSILLAPHKRT